jgi:hypothetical protein
MQGLVVGSQEWLMAMRVYYSGDIAVIQLLELYDAVCVELQQYKTIFKKEVASGTESEEDEWSSGG